MGRRVGHRPASGVAYYVLTTGEIATICDTTPRSVAKWIDAGMIEGSYTLPMSSDRRAPVLGLMKFMEKHNMKVPDILKGCLTVTCGVEFPPIYKIEANHCSNLIEFGKTLSPHGPATRKMVLGDQYGVKLLIEMAHQTLMVFPYCKIAAVLNEGTAVGELTGHFDKFQMIVQNPINWTEFIFEMNLMTTPTGEKK